MWIRIQGYNKMHFASLKQNWFISTCYLLYNFTVMSKLAYFFFYIIYITLLNITSYQRIQVLLTLSRERTGIHSSLLEPASGPPPPPPPLRPPALPLPAPGSWRPDQVPRGQEPSPEWEPSLGLDPQASPTTIEKNKTIMKIWHGRSTQLNILVLLWGKTLDCLNF